MDQPSNGISNVQPNANSRAFRGRFMDIVHPSSDVNLSAKPNHASEITPMQHIEPTKQVFQQPAQPAQPEIHQPQATETINSGPVDNKSQPTYDFADEITSVFEPMPKSIIAPNMTSQPVGPSQPQADVFGMARQSAAERPAEPSQLAEPKQDDNEQKLPFLPDIEVEKRPLGEVSKLNAPNTGSLWQQDFIEMELDSGGSPKKAVEAEALKSAKPAEPVAKEPQSNNFVFKAAAGASANVGSYSDKAKEQPKPINNNPATTGITEAIKTAEAKVEDQSGVGQNRLSGVQLTPPDSADHLTPKLDIRAALDNSVNTTYTKRDDVNPNTTQNAKSPYGHISQNTTIANSKRKNSSEGKSYPTWAWLLIALGLIQAGASIGILLYLLGWLG